MLLDVNNREYIYLAGEHMNILVESNSLHR